MLEKQVRLNVFISQYAPYSRRQADDLIRQKKVSVNGKKATHIEFVNPEKDHVKVRGKLISPQKENIYIAFNKPKKTLVTHSDPKGRATVFHYFNRLKTRIFAVGRLDWNTEGLLLLTNDGSFKKKIESPKSKILKTYMVKLDRVLSKGHLEKLMKGVTIPGGRVKATLVQRKPKAWVRIAISEGRNRQLHFMFAKIGFTIKKLKRIQIGKLKLGKLGLGEARFLTQKDINKIFQKTINKRKLSF